MAKLKRPKLVHEVRKKKLKSVRPLKKASKAVFRRDAKQTAILVKVGRKGSANAIRATKALGLSITYMKNGVLYKEFPDGRTEQLKSVEVKKSTSRRSVGRLKKGVILHAKK
ncbi:MAG: hypothetical protein IPJ66_06130 [Bacteroidetes bacterium]|nr:hypothetical protein [Bacteroidota bacterium]